MSAEFPGADRPPDWQPAYVDGRGTPYWRTLCFACVGLAILCGPVLFLAWRPPETPGGGLFEQAALAVRDLVVAVGPAICSLFALLCVRQAAGEIDRGTAPSTGVRMVDTMRALSLGMIAFSVLWFAMINRWEGERGPVAPEPAATGTPAPALP